MAALTGLVTGLTDLPLSWVAINTANSHCCRCCTCGCVCPDDDEEVDAEEGESDDAEDGGEEGSDEEGVGARSGGGRQRKQQRGARRLEPEIQQINKRTSKARQQAHETLDGPEGLPNMKPMMELEAGKNVWYQAYVLKESLNEAKVRFPREYMASPQLQPVCPRWLHLCQAPGIWGCSSQLCTPAKPCFYRAVLKWPACSLASREGQVAQCWK